MSTPIFTVFSVVSVVQILLYMFSGQVTLRAPEAPTSA